jgi:hypothetical protein
VGQRPLREVVLGQLAEVVAVEPAELVEVEDRADRVDARPVEGARQLLEGEDLLAVGSE